MTEKEFLEKRTPFWLEGESLLIRVPNNSDKNDIHAHLCKKFGYSWVFAIRGYYWPGSHVQIYTGNYQMPNITIYVLSYLFEFFKDIKYIGIGCIIGEPGEIWTPQIVVTKNNLESLKDDLSSQQ